MSEKSAIEVMSESVGKELGVSDWLEIDQERIDDFAKCTLDYQWIHIDKEKAAKGPFGTTIAHGYLTLSLLPYLGQGIGIRPEGVNITMGVNYGLNKFRLINPVAVGSKIRTRVVLKEVAEKGPGRILMTTENTIEIEGQDKPACVAETLSMLFYE